MECEEQLDASPVWTLGGVREGSRNWKDWSSASEEEEDVKVQLIELLQERVAKLEALVNRLFAVLQVQVLTPK